MQSFFPNLAAPNQSNTMPRKRLRVENQDGKIRKQKTRDEEGKHADSRSMQHGWCSTSCKGWKGFPKIRCLNQYLDISKLPGRMSSLQLPFCRISVLKTLANVAWCPLKKRGFRTDTGRGKRKMCYVVLWGDFRSQGKVKQKAAELLGVCKHTGNGDSVLAELHGRGVSWGNHVSRGKRRYLGLMSPRLED